MLQLDSDRRDRRCGCHSERRWRKSGAILALAVGCLMGVAAGSRAADATHAPVIVGARRLFDVGALPGETAADRAAAVNRRIDSFVRNPSGSRRLK